MVAVKVSAGGRHIGSSGCGAVAAARAATRAAQALGAGGGGVQTGGPGGGDTGGGTEAGGAISGGGAGGSLKTGVGNGAARTDGAARMEAGGGVTSGRGAGAGGATGAGRGVGIIGVVAAGVTTAGGAVITTVGAAAPAAGSAVRQRWPHCSQRNLRLRPASAASGTSYSVEQFGHDRRMMMFRMTFLRKPRNKARMSMKNNHSGGRRRLPEGARTRQRVARFQRGRMVRFDDVWLHYDPQGPADDFTPDVLREVSFTIPEGGFRWLTGPSGAGKTSLLKLIYLAAHPSRGRIDILGTDAARISRRDAAFLRRRIGVVYQDFRLLGHLSAFDNVALPMRLARRSEAQIHADVAEILRWVGLAGKLEARPAELSGGEQQRVAIARAVVGRPKLLVADEPTGNLDDEQAERLMMLITALNRLGTTVVVATHNLGLVARYPAPRLDMADGRIMTMDRAHA